MFTYDAVKTEEDLALCKLMLGSGPSGAGYRELGISPPMLKRLILAPHTFRVSSLYAMFNRLGVTPILCPWPHGATEQEASELAESMLELYTEHVVDGRMMKESQPDRIFAVLLVRPLHDVDFNDPGRMPVQMPEDIPVRSRDQVRQSRWPDPSNNPMIKDMVHSMAAYSFRRNAPTMQKTIDSMRLGSKFMVRADELSPHVRARREAEQSLAAAQTPLIPEDEDDAVLPEPEPEPEPESLPAPVAQAAEPVPELHEFDKNPGNVPDDDPLKL